MIKQIQKWFRVRLAVMAQGRTAHPMRQLKCFRGQLEVLVLMLVQRILSLRGFCTPAFLHVSLWAFVCVTARVVVKGACELFAGTNSFSSELGDNPHRK